MRKLAVVGYVSIFVLIGVLVRAQQDKSKRPSPPGTATTAFADGKNVTVDYSRPKINDPKTGKPREIFGELVPYDKVWRTGANEATTFVTNANLKVGTLTVPAGSYTLYTIPGQSEWTIIVNKQTGQWGTEYNEQQDLGRTKVKATKIDRGGPVVDPFTISFDKPKGKKTAMKLAWVTTQVSVPVVEQ